MTSATIAKRLEVNGIVQGVGFRPFIFQLAQTHRLKGEVANTATGVSLVIEGAPARIEAFIADLPAKAPPLAHIVEIQAVSQPVNGFRDFKIIPSRAGTRRATLISPDVSVCDDCLAEMRDPVDRRFGYPFINCTNCGPRYTIIEDVPYDRPKTSMRRFVMCPNCQAEYDDPTNRRFHAQPNACGHCGPRVTLCDREQRPMTGGEPIAAAAGLLKQGRIVAVKGLGGFHLACDATDPAAVARLRQRKRREEKPFAVMAPDLARIRALAWVAPDEERLLTSIQRPIVLLPKRHPNPLAEAVAPRNRYFGVMLPYTPLHHLLLEQGFDALVMTSGNLSEEPICIDNQEAFRRLGDIADAFLVHDRDIYLRSDDSIIRRAAGRTRFLRRSRGYVPVPVFLKRPLPQVLACGAELKNTVCLTKAKFAFISQHIGDLENRHSEEFFGMTIAHLKRILDIEPELIACDLHPDYLSTRYGMEQQGLPIHQIQHHHAHIVACMAENHVETPVIGLAFDGTGLGSDGTIWGGEVLLAELGRFQRLAHLKPVRLPGSTAAIREPWRMAVAHLQDAFGDRLAELPIAFIRHLEPKRLAIIRQMIRQQINAPLTSSMGRLFDAVAALVGLRQQAAFEGQAAMELEMAAEPTEKGIYPYQWDARDPICIDTAPIIRAVAGDLQNHTPPGVISARFHRTLVALFTALCRQVREQHGINQVALSGGVFQNTILLERFSRSLSEDGFTVYTHRQVPCNDGGIALGQALAAAAMAEGR